MSSTVSRVAFYSFHVCRYTCWRRTQLQVLPIVREVEGIRHTARQFMHLLSGAVRIFSLRMLTVERKTDDGGQNNDKCEYFKCLSTWQKTHIDHKHMYYISRTQHQFFLPIYSWLHVSALSAIHQEEWWSLVDRNMHDYSVWYNINI
jgi:hypothetical protein